MPISADSVQIAIVQESTYGVTPATPVFQVLPLISEGVVAEVTTQQSNMMTDDRQVLDLITTSIAAAGNIDSELAITPAMKILLASAMAQAWVAVSPDVSGLPPVEESMIGKEQISYTFERREPDPASPGDYKYQRITGCVSNTANVSVTTEDAATIAFGVIGKTLERSSAVLAGATYVTPDNPVVLRGPDVIKLDIAGQTISANCITSYTLDINNNYRGILCLGHLGNKEVAIGKAEITSAMEIYFIDNSLLDVLLEQTEVAIALEMQNTQTTGEDAEYFAAHIPRSKFTENNVSVEGTGTDVMNKTSIQALFNSSGTNDTLGTNDADKTSLRVVVGSGTVVA